MVQLSSVGRINQCNNKSLYVQSSPNIKKSKCFCCCTYADEVDDRNGDDCPTNFNDTAGVRCCP